MIQYDKLPTLNCGIRDLGIDSLILIESQSWIMGSLKPESLKHGDQNGSVPVDFPLNPSMIIHVLVPLTSPKLWISSQTAPFVRIDVGPL